MLCVCVCVCLCVHALYIMYVCVCARVCLGQDYRSPRVASSHKFSADGVTGGKRACHTYLTCTDPRVQEHRAGYVARHNKQLTTTHLHTHPTQALEFFRGILAIL